MDRLHVKFLLQSARTVKEIRRMQLDQTTTWSQLCDHVRSLFAVEQFDLTYQDPEGDWVALSSDAEWRECVQICGAPPLRITVRANRKARSTEAPEPATPVVEAAAPQTSQASAPVPILDLVQFYDSGRNALPDNDRQAEISAVVSRTLESFRTEHGLPMWLQPAVRLIGEDIDVNVNEFARCLDRRGLLLMETNPPDYHTAYTLFKTADEIRAGPNSMYNAACCQAQLGQLDEAIATLHIAVSRGYTNAAHVAVDEDLMPLHGNAQFQALLARLMQPVEEPIISAPAEVAPVVEHADADVAEDIVAMVVDAQSQANAEESASAPEAEESVPVPVPAAEESAPVPVAVESVAAPVSEGPFVIPEQFVQANRRLHAMGFVDSRMNVEALKDRNLAEAIDFLLSKRS